MTVAPSSKLALWGAALIWLGGQACAPTHKRLREGAVLSTAKREERPLAPARGAAADFGYYLVEASRPQVDGAQLAIYRAHLLALELGGSLVAKLAFGVDEHADYVSWQVCPYKAEFACHGGTSTRGEVLLGALVPGEKYVVSLRACVHQERAIDVQKLCGPWESLDWRQGPRKTTLQELWLSELFAKEKELKALGSSFFDALTHFREAFKHCPQSKGGLSSQARLLGGVEILVANILQLGPEFTADTMPFVRFDESDSELAAILRADLLQDSEAPLYLPKGYSLTTTSALDERALLERLYQNPSLEQGYLQTRAIAVPVMAIALASSGLWPRPQGRVLHLAASWKRGASSSEEPLNYKLYTSAEFASLSSWQRAAAFAGIFAVKANKLGLASEAGYEEYAAAELVRAMLKLGSSASLPGCSAYERMIATLVAISQHAQALKERVLELKEKLNVYHK